MSHESSVRNLVRLSERLTRLVVVCRKAWDVCRSSDYADDVSPLMRDLCDAVTSSRIAGDSDD